MTFPQICTENNVVKLLIFIEGIEFILLKKNKKKWNFDKNDFIKVTQNFKNKVKMQAVFVTFLL